MTRAQALWIEEVGLDRDLVCQGGILGWARVSHRAERGAMQCWIWIWNQGGTATGSTREGAKHLGASQRTGCDATWMKNSTWFSRDQRNPHQNSLDNQRGNWGTRKQIEQPQRRLFLDFELTIVHLASCSRHQRSKCLRQLGPPSTQWMKTIKMLQMKCFNL